MDRSFELQIGRSIWAPAGNRLGTGLPNAAMHKQNPTNAQGTEMNGNAKSKNPRERPQ